MVVRVIAATPGLRLGVVVGAEGEVLVFDRSPPDTIRLARADGQTTDAVLLRAVDGWPLAVVRASPDELPDVALPAPDFPRAHGRLLRLGWGDRGPEPALGSVDRPPDRRGVASVDVPGQPGAPLFDGSGRWIGISLDHRRRRSRAVSAAVLAPRLAAAR